ncbi:type II secretion system F family protein [Benzoatithermus flavus]|uniref:Type II secretion system F family protein n=1 Tax=Benzoatithermus flavus TaxID=3108223 RepID=A0ABU8XYT9_9PROT
MSIALLAPTLVAVVTFAACVWTIRSDRWTKRRVRQRIERATRSMDVRLAGSTTIFPASVRRKPARTFLGRFGRVLLRSWPRAAVLKQRLDAAGIRIGPVDFVVLWVMAGAGTASAANALYDISWIVSAGIGVITAIGLPQLLLGRRIAARQQKFVSQFPEAIDLIIRGVRSGLPVAEALQAAGEEFPSPVGALFQEVTGHIKIGKSLHQALTIAAQSIQSQEFKFFVISLTIQQETGGNLTEILQNLSTMIRRRNQARLKIKAMSSEARASAAIIGSLPFIMFGLLYLVDPDYVMKLFTDRRGHLLLGAGLLSLGTGIGIMRVMVRFDI